MRKEELVQLFAYSNVGRLRFTVFASSLPSPHHHDHAAAQRYPSGQTKDCSSLAPQYIYTVTRDHVEYMVDAAVYQRNTTNKCPNLNLEVVLQPNNTKSTWHLADTALFQVGRSMLDLFAYSAESLFCPSICSAHRSRRVSTRGSRRSSTPFSTTFGEWWRREDEKTAMQTTDRLRSSGSSAPSTIGPTGASFSSSFWRSSTSLARGAARSWPASSSGCREEARGRLVRGENSAHGSIVSSAATPRTTLQTRTMT